MGMEEPIDLTCVGAVVCLVGFLFVGLFVWLGFCLWGCLFGFLFVGLCVWLGFCLWGCLFGWAFVGFWLVDFFLFLLINKCF